MTDRPAGMNRREFLGCSKATGLGLAAGVGVLASAASARATPAADRITLAIAGVRGRGLALARGFLDRRDCRIAYLCDVDAGVLAARARAVTAQQGAEPQCVTDFRRALDDRAVDALVVATPDHWHALATVWACQAGKDVYVEKPASHNAAEGLRMVQAARKYGRVVQVGLQNRSAAYLREAKAYLDAGKLGPVHLVRVFNMRHQGNFGQSGDSPPPEGLDWDMWNGPAPQAAYNATLHRGWQHLWRYSGGDVLHEAIPQIDIARWLCGLGTPRAVHATGGRFHSEGAAETPDTLVASLDFDGLVMTFEQSLCTPYMLKTDGRTCNSDAFPYWPQNSSRVEIYGSEGVLYVGRHGAGWQVFGRPRDGEPQVVAQGFGRYPDPEHKADFCRAVRTRVLPSADIEQAVASDRLAHLINTSYRLGGERLSVDPRTGQVLHRAAGRFLARDYRQPWGFDPAA